MGKLTAIGVRSAKPGRHGDGDGLFLLVKPTGARSWMLRIQANGKRRDIGLGTADLTRSAMKPSDVDAIPIPILNRRLLTLAEAREKAALLRSAAKAGLDPVEERDRERTVIPTFAGTAKLTHEALRAGWSDKAAASFLSSLERHAFPTLGSARVDAVTAADITTALAPIWTAKPEVARKVRQRIGTVLNFAHGKGWRPTEAPGRSVTVALPRQPRGRHFSAMPYADVPRFVAELRAQFLTAGRSALIFQILTAARGAEVRAARWGQIDADAGEWRRPATIMKNGVAHVVTLSSAAIALLDNVRGYDVNPDDLIFPGRGGRALSDATIRKCLRDAGQPYDAHGFRSSFRDYAAEQRPDLPDAVAEHALAHTVGDAVVRAYRQTSLIEMRRMLLESWGQFVSSDAGAVCD